MTLGIRPEFFSLVSVGQGDLDVDVVMIEMTGADGYLHFELPVAPGPIEIGLAEETIPHRRQQVTARIEPKLLPRAGTRVRLAIDFARTTSSIRMLAWRSADNGDGSAE